MAFATRICTALIIVTPLLAFALQPRQQSSYNFDGTCSQDQQNSVGDYLDDMQDLAKAATGPSEASNAGNSWYKAWWGTYESGMLLNEKINTRFEKLSVWKTNKGTSRTFSCDDDSECCNRGIFPGGVVGCQDERGGDVIVLCKPFWRWSPERIGNLAIQTQPISLELDKWRSRPAILLHELTHALFRTFDQVWYPNGDKTSAYGHVHDLQYTLNNTGGARLNADHYEKFATAAYYSKGNVGWFATNPNDVTSGPHY